MKQLTLLLALVVLTTSTVGCGCCRRLRDRLCRGAYCGPSAVAAPAALTSPALMAGPAAVPVQTPVAPPQYQQPIMFAPQPMMTNCVPCVPCDPCCIPYDPCGGNGYYGTGYPSGGLYGSGWSEGCDCADGGYLSAPVISTPTDAPTNQVDPGPAGDRGA